MSDTGLSTSVVSERSPPNFTESANSRTAVELVEPSAPKRRPSGRLPAIVARR